VGGYRKRVILDCFWLFHYAVITSTNGQNFGSKFGCILGWNMKLERRRSTCGCFWCPSRCQKTPNRCGHGWV